MPKKIVSTRNTTVGEDLKDIAKGIGRSVGGMLGNARDAIQNHKANLDAAEDAATGSTEPDNDSDDMPALSQYHAQTSDRNNGY